jgi:4-alpha-glucanotransferase
MSDAGLRQALPPFLPDYRGAGLLLHVTSLPSPYGIGDVGPAAYQWVDQLAAAGIGWWQALPLGPTGYGNSPYQPMSSFAGNDLLTSPDLLIEQGLLQKADFAGESFPAGAVDFERVIPFKHRLHGVAWQRFAAAPRSQLRDAFEAFRHQQAGWLEDYALFRALKAKFNGVHYLDWPPDLVERQPAAIAAARRELADVVAEVCFAQFLLFSQGARLRDYAHDRGMRLIGDLPFFVSPDSADVWTNPGYFLLDERRRPRFVAGVPPDFFSADGQLWGNPVYDWETLRRDGYRWCIERLHALLAHVDVVRLDHFRGFAAAWHIPAGSPNARTGQWVPGPGTAFFEAARRELGGLPFLAEDLGVITPDVVALRNQFQIPGTRVLQFAFDGHEDNPFLPQNYPTNTVVYTGTHDNATTGGWYQDLPADQRRNLWGLLQRSEGTEADVAPALLALAWSSRAALAVAPLQDVHNLGNEARMNVPGRAEGNWGWRCDDRLLAPAIEHLRLLTRDAGRALSAASPASARRVS